MIYLHHISRKLTKVSLCSNFVSFDPVSSDLKYSLSLARLVVTTETDGCGDPVPQTGEPVPVPAQTAREPVHAGADNSG